MSDHKGARLILDALPPAKALLADRGYDSNWFRDALAKRGCEPCIPSTKSRKIPLPYDKALYKQRHKIENMFARLKDWRRIATRYYRCAHSPDPRAASGERRFFFSFRISRKLKAKLLKGSALIETFLDCRAARFEVGAPCLMREPFEDDDAIPPAKGKALIERPPSWP